MKSDKPRLFQIRVSKIWILTYRDNKALFGPSWKELLRIFYAANPEKLPKNAK